MAIAMESEKVDGLVGHFIQIYEKVHSLVSELVEAGKMKEQPVRGKEVGKQSVKETFSKINEILRIQEENKRFKAEQEAKLREEQREQAQRANGLVVENQKLAQEVSLLSRKLQSVEMDTDIIQLKRQMETVEAQLQLRIDVLVEEQRHREQQLLKANQTMAQLKTKIQKQEAEIKTLDKYIQDHDDNYKLMEAKFGTLQANHDHWRELALMQHEDLNHHLARFLSYVQDEAKSRHKLLKLQTKIDKLTIERSKEVDVPENPKFNHDQD